MGNRNAIGKKGNGKLGNLPVTALLSSGVRGRGGVGRGSQPPPH